MYRIGTAIDSNVEIVEALTPVPRETIRQVAVRNAVEGICRSHVSTRVKASHDAGQSPGATAILKISKTPSGEPVETLKLVIVVHYHELWLKGGNRRFFLSKLHMALKRALEGLPVERILRPGDRLLIEFGDGASEAEAIARIERVFGIAFYAVARVVARTGEDDLEALGRAAWEEIRDQKFSTFAVRAKRSDKKFPYRTIDIEASVGQYLVERLRDAGREARVKLTDPDLTCRIEIPPGPSLLVYARKIPGAEASRQTRRAAWRACFRVALTPP